jgi:hypothetical protein
MTAAKIKNEQNLCKIIHDIFFIFYWTISTN